MKITIQAPDFKPRETLTSFVEDNVGKLALLSDRIIEGRVYLKLDKSDSRENKVCEIKLSSSRVRTFSHRSKAAVSRML